MSGGVDSSVAAVLMQQKGFDCLGVTMKLYDGTDEQPQSKTCCSLNDVQDARQVAYSLGIPFYVFNFTKDFEEQVIRRFISCYEQGKTPNPCIDCNRYIKFDRLIQRAMQLGYDYVVTGHYAQIEYRPQDGRYLLKKGKDPGKDQSYVLFHMTQHQLAHTLLPLGGMDKSEVRKIALANNLINAKKQDSQDICFVPDGNYARFIEDHSGLVYPEGQFLDENGKPLGKHKGIVHYTIGQRKGLNLSSCHPLYVKEIDVKANAITLSRNQSLLSDSFVVSDLNWIAISELSQPMKVLVKTRYHQPEQPATVLPAQDGTVTVMLDQPMRAITPGQAAVFYSHDVVVGGGTILPKG